MKLFLILVFGLGASLLIAEELPRDASDVVAKLERFETEEREKAEKKIRDQREKVAKYLRQILDRETRSGNLSSANAVKAKIDSLTPVEVKSEEPEKSGLDRDARWLLQGEWKKSDAPRTLVFSDDRTGKQTNNDGKIPIIWREQNGKLAMVELSKSNEDTHVWEIEFKNRKELTMKRVGGIPDPRHDAGSGTYILND